MAERLADLYFGLARPRLVRRRQSVESHCRMLELGQDRDDGLLLRGLGAQRLVEAIDQGLLVERFSQESDRSSVNDAPADLLV